MQKLKCSIWMLNAIANSKPTSPFRCIVKMFFFFIFSFVFAWVRARKIRIKCELVQTQFFSFLVDLMCVCVRLFVCICKSNRPRDNLPMCNETNPKRQHVFVFHRRSWMFFFSSFLLVCSFTLEKKKRGAHIILARLFAIAVSIYLLWERKKKH